MVQDLNIDIHSYDYLLDSMRGRLGAFAKLKDDTGAKGLSECFLLDLQKG